MSVDFWGREVDINFEDLEIPYIHSCIYEELFPNIFSFILPKKNIMRDKVIQLSLAHLVVALRSRTSRSPNKKTNT